MADKPRVKAPKQRATQRRADEEKKRRQALMLAGAGLVAVLAVVGVVALLGIAGGGASEEDARVALEEAGCTLQVVDALPGAHSIDDPDGTSDKWNTDPPTSGPHYGFDPNGNLGTVIWGAYTEPVQLARLVHNLEHGGIYILYGKDVPDTTVAELRSFYDDHERGTVLAPLPRLGDQIALGAWVSDGESGNAYLAKCEKFDDDAFSTFFSAFQFQGPERFPASRLLPGGN